MNFSRFEPYKVLAHYNKLKELSRCNFVEPVQMIVYPSNICMLNCGHCIMTPLRRCDSVLPEKTLDKLVVDCSRMGVKSVIFSGGGEPLTNRYIIATARKLRDLSIETALNTNGILINGDTPFDNIRVSVDAANRETYKKVKGYDGWQRLNDNLNRLTGYKELGLAFLVTHENFREIHDFCVWAQQFPYTFLHIRPAYWPKYDIQIKEHMTAIIRDKDILEAKFRGLNISVDKFEGHWTARNYQRCYANGLKSVLTADGSFIVCQDRFDKFGDYNNKTFEDCWFTDEHRHVLDNICLDKCPRCVECNTNEIIEHCVKNDSLKIGLV